MLWICGSVGVLAAGVILLRGRSAVKGTTLTAAWGWAAAATLVWAGAWLLDIVFSAVSQGLADRFWSMAAILMLCPPIAVLGSRRPATRVWPWFVLLPLILVLGLPVVSTWRDLFAPERLWLEAPTVLGLSLVLAMGAGNYLGTRFTLAAVLFAVAELLLIASLTAWLSDAVASPHSLRIGATIALSLAAIAGGRRTSDSARAASPAADPRALEAYNRLWIDFRDWFGIVWALRLQDRVNAIAEKQQWPAHLELRGFIWKGDGDARGDVEQTTPQIEETLRWLLRRYVDAEWISARIGSQSSESEPRPSEKRKAIESRNWEER